MNTETTPPVRIKTSSVTEEDLQSFKASLDAGIPFNELLYKVLQKHDGGRWKGVGYALTKDNLLPQNWLLQTPNVWGQSAGNVKKGAGIYVANSIQKLIAGANQFIDITSLHPYPDGQFKSAIQAGLISLAKAGTAVTVRILTGWSPIDFGLNQRKYLEELIEPLRSIKTGKLQIYVGAQRTDDWSWNHAKMVAVDGSAAILGGENLWSGDYLEMEPVHDMNVMIQGSLVYYLHTFTNFTWQSVCNYIEPDWESVYWQSGAKDITRACLGVSPVQLQPGPGKLSMLGAGRYGSLGDVLGNPADYAMLYAFSAAQSAIRIAQQDLVMSEKGIYKVWEAGMTEIARALVRQVDVYIVISNDNAKAGSGNGYSTSTVYETANVIAKYVSDQPNAPKGDALVKLLCSKLHLSTLRFGPSNAWPNGYEFANHAKFFMVDDKVFYVGSENLYPSDLIEYGVFISDAAAMQQMKTDYWDKLWSYSQRVAISGPEAAKCYFRG